MKNITLLFCLFLANILLGACSGGEDEKKEMDEGKGAYALFLKIHYCEYWGKSDGCCGGMGEDFLGDNSW